MPLNDRDTKILWGKAAGRCQLCNELLLTAESGFADHVAQRAHIVSKKPGGHRGDPIRSLNLDGDIKNHMLLCANCHGRADPDGDGRVPTEEELLDRKRKAEARVRLVTGARPGRETTVAILQAPFGDRTCPVDEIECLSSVMPDRLPIEEHPPRCIIPLYEGRDDESSYYERNATEVRAWFDNEVRQRLIRSKSRHLSLFAIGPQPLLVFLGSLVSDAVDCTVHQLQRDPHSWEFLDDKADAAFTVSSVKRSTSSLALVLSLTASVSQERVDRALPGDASIVELSAERLGRDSIRTRRDMKLLGAKIHEALKLAHEIAPDAKEINVFPVAPLSASIELGRAHFPKAQPPLSVWDCISPTAGFVKRLTISGSQFWTEKTPGGRA